MFLLKDRYEIARVSGTEAEWRAALSKVDARTAQTISSALGLLPKRENQPHNPLEITFSTRGANAVPISQVLLALHDAVMAQPK